MRAAPNLDPAYIAAFEAIIPRSRRQAWRQTLYPFFLEGVAGQAGKIQQDGMHPTFAGVKAIVTRILPTIKRGVN